MEALKRLAYCAMHGCYVFDGKLRDEGRSWHNRQSPLFQVTPHSQPTYCRATRWSLLLVGLSIALGGSTTRSIRQRHNIDFSLKNGTGRLRSEYILRYGTTCSVYMRSRSWKSWLVSVEVLMTSLTARQDICQEWDYETCRKIDSHGESTQVHHSRLPRW